VFPKWAWSGTREQFVNCGLREFRHSKSSVYRWYPQLVRGRFVYTPIRQWKATRSRHGWVHMFITHCLQLNLQLQNIDLVRTCRTSSFYTVAWQLARFQLTRRIARSLGDSWASCTEWQWHQLGHVQVCTSLQPDNHANTLPFSFLQARCPSCRPTNSVKALKTKINDHVAGKHDMWGGVKWRWFIMLFQWNWISWFKKMSV